MSKLKYICFVSIDLVTYDLKITSYDATLSFFYRWIYNLHDYSTYQVIINLFFDLNLKLCKILRFTIQSYNLQFHLLSMILYKIPIMTTLNCWVISLRLSVSQFCFSFSLFSKVCKTRPSRLPKKKKDDFCDLFNSLI